MKHWPMLVTLLLFSFLYGLAVELLAARASDAVDRWLNLTTELIFVLLVVALATKLTADNPGVATVATAATMGAVMGVGLTLGLWFPFAISIGNRDTGQWLPGEYNVLALVLWDGILGGVLGIAFGCLSVILRGIAGQRRRRGGQRP